MPSKKHLISQALYRNLHLVYYLNDYGLRETLRIQIHKFKKDMVVDKSFSFVELAL